MEEDAVGFRGCKMNHRFNESKSKINFVFGRFKNSFVESRDTIGREVWYLCHLTEVPSYDLDIAYLGIRGGFSSDRRFSHLKAIFFDLIRARTCGVNFLCWDLRTRRLYVMYM